MKSGCRSAFAVRVLRRGSWYARVGETLKRLPDVNAPSINLGLLYLSGLMTIVEALRIGSGVLLVLLIVLVGVAPVGPLPGIFIGGTCPHKYKDLSSKAEVYDHNDRHD